MAQRSWLEGLARSVARAHGVPENLFVALVEQESGFNPRAVSSAGAMGLTQLMPSTARALGVKNPFDPLQNLTGGARYLRQQFERFGRWDLALAAYNAGPGAVQKYRGIPPYRETRNYVASIQRKVGRTGGAAPPVEDRLVRQRRALLDRLLNSIRVLHRLLTGAAS